MRAAAAALQEVVQSMILSTVRLSANWEILLILETLLQKGQRTPLMVFANSFSKHCRHTVCPHCRSLGLISSWLYVSRQIGHSRTSLIRSGSNGEVVAAIILLPRKEKRKYKTLILVHFTLSELILTVKHTQELIVL